MDKISNPIRQGSVDLKEVVQNWEEELFAMLIADKETYLPGKVDEFYEETHRDYQLIHAKVSATYDLGIITKEERDILCNKYYEIKCEYAKSKVKEECSV